MGWWPYFWRGNVCIFETGPNVRVANPERVWPRIIYRIFTSPSLQTAQTQLNLVVLLYINHLRIYSSTFPSYAVQTYPIILLSNWVVYKWYFLPACLQENIFLDVRKQTHSTIPLPSHRNHRLFWNFCFFNQGLIENILWDSLAKLLGVCHHLETIMQQRTVCGFTYKYSLKTITVILTGKMYPYC